MQQHLEAGIAALEARRDWLGNAATDTCVATLREALAAARSGAVEEPAQRLKQVSILFLDIVGSTTLSQRLDPEEIHAVMDGALERYSAIVGAHQGKVLQYAGDNLLAAFGVDITREDDAENAVRCGLALLAAARVLGAQVRTVHGHDGFDVRLGVHTGGVLLGGGVDGDGTIRGIAVNIAARMEQTAPVGQLRISHATFVQVRGLFEVDPQPPLQVKGVDEPIRSYLVLRQAPHAFNASTRGLEEIAAPMFGRAAESAALLQLLQEVASGGGCRSVSIVGEAGLGKSRLVAEFESAATASSASLRVLRARAVTATAEQPYGMLRELFAAWTGFRSADSSNGGARIFEARLVPLFEPTLGTEMAEAQAHVLGFLLGLDFGGSRHLTGLREQGSWLRERGFHVAIEALKLLAREADSPLLLLLDDVHWSDDESLQLLARLATLRTSEPILLLSLHRPTLYERHPAWPGGERHLALTLAPLPPEGGQKLAAALLAPLGPSGQALQRLLIERADGNPFYMEEIVRMLVDDGVIDVHGRTWTLNADRLRADRIPLTLSGVLQSRLDGLPAPGRACLQRASVIGMVFGEPILRALDEPSPAELPGLERRGLIHEDVAGATVPERQYAFHHQLLHAVTYATVLKRVRRPWHLQVARWMVAQGDAGGGPLLGEVAHHFEEGGDPAEAAEHYVRSAEFLQPRYAHAAVVAHATRALTLAAESALGLRFRALLTRQRSYRLQGRMAEQEADLQVLEDLAEALDDEGARATVAGRRVAALRASGDAAAAIAAVTPALERADAAGDTHLQAALHAQWLGALRSLGRYAQAEAVAAKGLAVAREHGHRAVESELLLSLASLALDAGDPSRATALLRQSLAIDRETGNQVNETATLVNLGDAGYRLGNFETARRDTEAALRLARDTGARQLEAVCWLNLAGIHHFSGRHEQALEAAEAACATARESSNDEFLAFALMAMGHAQLGANRAQEARASYERSRQTLVRLGQPHLAIEAEAGLARVAMAEGDSLAAQQHANSLMRHLDEGHTLDGTEHPLWIRLTLWQVLSRSSPADPRAASALSQAIGELEERLSALSDDADRERMRQAVPYHRALLEAHRATSTPA